MPEGRAVRLRKARAARRAEGGRARSLALRAASLWVSGFWETLDRIVGRKAVGMACLRVRLALKA